MLLEEIMQKDRELHSSIDDGHLDDESEQDAAEMDADMPISFKAAPYKELQGEPAGFIATLGSVTRVTARGPAGEHLAENHLAWRIS